nr:heat shock factor protein 1-like [Leptinotarsa decemlineata]
MEEIVEVLEEPSDVGMTVPLFIKKLWNMVNDRDEGDIIGWNDVGDSFIIHDRLQFTTKLLPHYFKHNNLSSFVRQLNFYNFRKVSNVEDKLQYEHSCFMKGVPQVLVFIRRKNPAVHKQTSTTNVNEAAALNNLLKDIKAMKSRHSQIDKEMSTLKQDNTALWNELNSLRMKYAKQSSVINKLIHFLITYIHTHQTSFSKQNIRVPRNINTNKLQPGPTLLELDYQHSKDTLKDIRTGRYTVPGSSKTITYSLKLPEGHLESNRNTNMFSRDSSLPKKNTQSLKEILALNEPCHQAGRIPKNMSQSGRITYSVKLPGNQPREKMQSDIQRSLLKILEDNEKLSIENSLEQELTEIQSDNTLLIDSEQNQIFENLPVVESPPMENSSNANSESTNMVSFVKPGTDFNMQIFNNPQANSSSKTKGGNSQLVSMEGTSYSNSTKNNTHDHTKALDPKIAFSNRIKIMDKKRNNHSESMSRGLQSPQKKIKKKVTEVSSFNEQQVNQKASVQPEIENNLLEMLKESQTASTDNSLEQIFYEFQTQGESFDITNRVQETFPIIESPPEPENFCKNYSVSISQPELVEMPESNINEFPDLEPIIQSPTDEVDISSNMSKNLARFSILENPKQNLGLYIDNTQEELNMLQEILNNLNSKDYGDIPGNAQRDENIYSSGKNNENQIEEVDNKASSSNIADIESLNTCNSPPTPTVSVDEYFNPNFMINNN